MKTFIHSHCQELPSNLHVILREAYVKEVNDFNASLHKILAKGFAMDSEARFDCLVNSERDVYKFSVSELKQVFNSLVNQYLLRKFNASFKKDEQG